jgi:hypothetical protein
MRSRRHQMGAPARSASPDRKRHALIRSRAIRRPVGVATRRLSREESRQKLNFGKRIIFK